MTFLHHRYLAGPHGTRRGTTRPTTGTVFCFPGQLIKSFVLSMEQTSLGNSVSRHSVERRSILRLNAPFLVATMKPRSCSASSSRAAVDLPIFNASAASRTE